MDKNMLWPRDEARSSGRRRRPMTRRQEFAVLAVAFAVGVALQLAYVFNAAAVMP